MDLELARNQGGFIYHWIEGAGPGALCAVLPDPRRYWVRDAGDGMGVIICKKCKELKVPPPMKINPLEERLAKIRDRFLEEYESAEQEDRDGWMEAYDDFRALHYACEQLARQRSPTDGLSIEDPTI